MKLPVLDQDKANHAFYGAYIYLAGALASVHAGTPELLTGLLTVSVVAIGKEIYDKVSHKGTSDAWDAFYTVLGAVPCMVLDFTEAVKVIG